jgi:hypothetical protein
VRGNHGIFSTGMANAHQTSVCVDVMDEKKNATVNMSHGTVSIAQFCFKPAGKSSSDEH